MNQQNTNKEILVNRLQGALAKFRNERDQLHRSKRLALERCRLMQAEEEALSKTVQTLCDKYEVLVASTTKIDTELGPLEQQVQQDTKEMQFQHAELLGARGKIKQMMEDVAHTTNTREDTIYKTRLFASQVRTTSATHKKKICTPRLSLKEQTEGLKHEFEDMLDFMDLLYKCMDERTALGEARIEALGAQARGMEEQVANYHEERTTMPLPVMDNNTITTGMTNTVP